MDWGFNGNWLLRPLLMNLLVYTFVDHFTYDEPSHSPHFAVDDVAFVFNFYTLLKKKSVFFLFIYCVRFYIILRVCSNTAMFHSILHALVLCLVLAWFNLANLM